MHPPAPLSPYSRHRHPRLWRLYIAQQPAQSQGALGGCQGLPWFQLGQPQQATWQTQYMDPSGYMVPGYTPAPSMNTITGVEWATRVPSGQPASSQGGLSQAFPQMPPVPQTIPWCQLPGGQVTTWHQASFSETLKGSGQELKPKSAALPPGQVRFILSKSGQVLSATAQAWSSGTCQILRSLCSSRSRRQLRQKWWRLRSPGFPSSENYPGNCAHWMCHRCIC